MNNLTIKIKVKQRLNKLASNDYDNITDWQIVEAFNKASLAWCRRALEGYNLSKTGDEATQRRIDDMQVLLVSTPIKMSKNTEYYISQTLPTDYLEWKRISAKAIHGCCNEPRKLVIYLAKEADVDNLLADYNKRPSFEWAETFCTIAGNKVKVYTDSKFEVVEPVLTYYKLPTKIEIKGASNPYTGQISLKDVETEFKDDIVEIFIDEAVKILAGDIESINIHQIANTSVESNT
jgi:hypothetical protein